MKKYRLKKWYPSLDNDFEVGDMVYYNGLSNLYVRARSPHYSIDVNEVENNPDFWELIEEEKPKTLFITDDDVKFFSETSREFYIVVNFIKYRSTISDFEDQKKLSHKVFYYESNADEYIWRNKRVFSYEDMMKAKHSIILTDEDIEKAAKERSKE